MPPALAAVENRVAGVEARRVLRRRNLRDELAAVIENLAGTLRMAERSRQGREELIVGGTHDAFGV